MWLIAQSVFCLELFVSPVRCVHTEVGCSQVSGMYPCRQGVPRNPLGPFKKPRFHSHLQLTILLQTCLHKHSSSELILIVKNKKHGETLWDFHYITSTQILISVSLLSVSWDKMYGSVCECWRVPDPWYFLEETLLTFQDVLCSLNASQRGRAVHKVYHCVAL